MQAHFSDNSLQTIWCLNSKVVNDQRIDCHTLIAVAFMYCLHYFLILSLIIIFIYCKRIHTKNSQGNFKFHLPFIASVRNHID